LKIGRFWARAGRNEIRERKIMDKEQKSSKEET
jgi:hypothetical protein